MSGKDINVFERNQSAWDLEAKRGGPWSVPVSHQAIEDARKGKWSIILTPTKPVPRNWLGLVEGMDILCLASGGGQQAPILSAAGANVTVYDASFKQLEQDREVALREQLPLLAIQGDMANLKDLSDESYDMIIHPCSNCFVPDILPVWKECYRVLRHSGVLLSGFINPVFYASDRDLQEEGQYVLKHSIPYSDLTQDVTWLNAQLEKQEPIEFGHSLEQQLGGQIAAGFLINGFYEDYWGIEKLDKYLPQFIATRAIKQ